MKVLCCGGRNYKNGDALWNTMNMLHETHKFTLLIHGGAAGADVMGGMWAKEKGVPVQVFPAKWKEHGYSAGSIRNQQMLDEGKPDMVVAFPGGRGTADMVRRATSAGVRVVAVASPTPTNPWLVGEDST
jgi:hypothetical protein